jgi:hypothetical protein
MRRYSRHVGRSRGQAPPGNEDARRSRAGEGGPQVFGLNRSGDSTKDRAEMTARQRTFGAENVALSSRAKPVAEGGP